MWLHVNDNFHKTTRQSGGQSNKIFLNMQMSSVVRLHYTKYDI